MTEALITTNLERTKRQLSNPEVQARLSSVASKLLLLTDSLYVPSISTDGKIDADKSGIPIVALEPGTELHLSGDSLGFSDEQRRAMSNRGIGLAEQDRMEATLQDKAFIVQDWMNGATIARRGTYATNDGDITVSGRPVVVLNSSSTKVNQANTILPHELVHVAQDQYRPFNVKKGYPWVQREAEAYTVEARIQEALQKREPLPTKSVRVRRAYEELRSKGGRTVLKDKTEQLAFERALREQGIGILAPSVDLPDSNHGS